MNDIPIHPPLDRPVTNSLRCMLGMHDDRRLWLLPGQAKRMVCQRVGCLRCGRVKILKMFGMGWGHWGYLPPDVVATQVMP